MTNQRKTYGDNFKIDPTFDSPPFKPRAWFNLSQVDEVIQENQERAQDWSNCDVAKRLVGIAKALVDGLNIEVKVGEPLKVPTFDIRPMNRKCFGDYNAGRNGLGVIGTISVNEKLLTEQRTDVSGRQEPALRDNALALYLLPLLLRAWRYQTGGSGNLDGTVKAKLRSCGITLGKKTIERINPDGTFARVLACSGYGDPPKIELIAGGEGKSSNRLWSCNCQRARIGRGRFIAHCPLCHRDFELGDHVGKHLVV